jgi:formate dehydrogenase subunit delta
MNTDDKLVYMANQIALNFAARGDARAATADHIAKFWDPGMKTRIFRRLEEPGNGLSTDAAAAVERVRGVAGSGAL